MDTMNFTQAIVTIVSALIGGGLLAFIGDRLKRKDQKEDKNDEVTKKLDNMEKSFTEQIQGVKADLKVLSDSQAEKSAIDARRDILRFNDELLNNVDHSHEMFLQIMDDIATYDKYCADHDEFMNGRTVQSASNIKRTYERLFDSHKITS